MALDPRLAAEIEASVAEGFADQVAHTQALIRFASLRGAEHACQDYVFEQFRARGYATERLAMDRATIAAHPGGSRIDEAHHSDAPIVVGHHRPSAETGRSLILQAHVDVVPTGPSTCGPIGPSTRSIEGDWLYGRGAGDMKAGHAANLFALDALARLGLQPAASVIRAVGGRGGIHRQRRPDDPPARLPGRRRADPRARGREARARQYRRAVVHRGGPGRAGPRARDGRGRQRHRRHLPGDRQAPGGRGPLERREGRAPAFRVRGPPDQPQHRQDRGRRLGLLGPGLVPDPLPHRASIRA